MNKSRSVLSEKNNLCCGCSACASSCPVNCVSMIENTEGFLYPEIDVTRCINCDKCKTVCPVLTNKRGTREPENTWAVIANDANIQVYSSSGGVFTLLAVVIIQSGGIVFGAAFTDDFHKVHHIGIEKIEDIERLRTSKYLQSDVEDSFVNIEEQLKAGRKVLFSGTPCQIAGLKSFLGQRKNDNLICVAIICHGVPSPKLWGRYLDHVAEKYAGNIKSVNFRHKKHGWKSFGLNMEIERNNYYKKMTSDPYMQMFLKNLCLRESCYQCSAKEINPGADLTLGDFWGVERVVPEMYDKMGTSLVIIHTEKGDNLFESISDHISRKAGDFDLAIRHNKAYSTSVRRPVLRDVFFRDLDGLSWKEFEKKYGNVEFRKWIKKKILKAYRGIFIKSL